MVIVILILILIHILILILIGVLIQTLGFLLGCYSYYKLSVALFPPSLPPSPPLLPFPLLSCSPLLSSPLHSPSPLLSSPCPVLLRFCPSETEAGRSEWETEK